MSGDPFRSALAVLTVDPAAVGGLWLRARAGPLRSMLTDALALLPLPIPLKRLPPNVGDDALFGGLDMASTLHSGRPVLRRGLLDRPTAFLLPMAERCDRGLCARLAQALDRRQHALIALDEAAEEGEGLPMALADRLGLFLDLTDVRSDRLTDLLPDPAQVEAARARLSAVKLPHEVVRQVVAACAGMAITSQRAPMLALAAARALAALAGRNLVEQADMIEAAEMTLSHRAAPMVAPPPATDDADPPPPDPAGAETPATDPGQGLPAEILVDAARAALPDSILRQLEAGRAARSARGSTGSGAEKAGNRQGRPLPSRKGKPQGDARLDLVATLRAAAPWQPLRRAEAPHRAGQMLLVDPTDLHIRRSKQLSDRLLIFAVDASGSAAVARLAEAKGAVELLLAQAYSRRDHVALLTFRGQGAALILPPSRSLVATKQKLRGLPGGGGTPLAQGLQLALTTARQARRRGLTPTIALLTDGRGNIALDGTADRALAEDQATQLARAIRAAGAPAVVIDVSTRPNPRLTTLAQAMGARYVALPRATASRLADVLGAALET
ncbi:MAG: magnesium chelatase subunit D [Fuscovulum sp.]|nr:magnesium chelatase subunit D [Fuscovulum sp.]